MHAVRGSYLAVGALIATISPFLAPILEQRGFSAAGIGLVLAITAAGNALAMPVWGHLGDVTMGRRRALQAAGIGGALGAVLFGLAGALPAIAATLIAYSVLTAGCSSLLDAIGVNAVAHRPELYGRFRVLMSISYALVALAVGAIYTSTGYGTAPVLAIACALVVVLVAQAVPDVRRAKLGDYAAPDDDQTRATGDERRLGRAFGSIAIAVRVEPRVVGVMATVVLAGIGYTTALTFVPLRLVEVGGDPTIVALSSTVSALCEVPAMLLAARFVRPVGLRGLGVVACCIYAVSLASWVIVRDPLLIVAVRALLGVGFGIMTVASVLTIGSLLPAQLQASGQALLGMSFSGIAWTIASLVGGVVYDQFGHAPVFALAGIVALTGVVLAWAFLPARGEVRTAMRG